MKIECDESDVSHVVLKKGFKIFSSCCVTVSIVHVLNNCGMKLHAERYISCCHILTSTINLKLQSVSEW